MYPERLIGLSVFFHNVAIYFLSLLMWTNRNC